MSTHTPTDEMIQKLKKARAALDDAVIPNREEYIASMAKRPEMVEHFREILEQYDRHENGGYTDRTIADNP